LSKSTPDTTLERFVDDLSRMVQANPALDVTPASDIKAELLRKGQRFLYRFEMPVMQTEITRWAEDMSTVAHAAGRSLTDGRFWRNLTACEVNGRRCPYLSVCDHGWKGNINFELKPVDPWAPQEARADEAETENEASHD
jgi:hypothetical protein